VIELIDTFADAGRADFARDLARPLPGTTMFSWFGFPEEDHRQLLAWFSDMLERDAGDPALPARAIAGRDRMREYMQAAAAERLRAPREDLMSVLVEARRRAASAPTSCSVPRCCSSWRASRPPRADLELAAPPRSLP
jgi:cytochrome P450